MLDPFPQHPETQAPQAPEPPMQPAIAKCSSTDWIRRQNRHLQQSAFSNPHLFPFSIFNFQFSISRAAYVLSPTQFRHKSFIHVSPLARAPFRLPAVTSATKRRCPTARKTVARETPAIPRAYTIFDPCHNPLKPMTLAGHSKTERAPAPARKIRTYNQSLLNH
jgi:hypothetical protein